jgi:hypothetical protein
MKKELQTTIKCSPKFTVPIDESTDVAGLVQLLVFVRYCFEENVWEELCLSPSEICARNEILRAVFDCFTAEGVSLAAVQTEQQALTGHKTGFHREALASRDYDSELHSVLPEAMAVVNSVKFAL